MCNDSGNSPIGMFMGFSSIQHIVFSHANLQIRGAHIFDTMRGSDYPISR